MTKKQKKITSIRIVFAVFFLTFFFAAGCQASLELEYPDVEFGGEVLSVGPGSTLVQFARYFLAFGSFLGFTAAIFSMVYAGVLYFLSPILQKPNLLSEARERVTGAISGVLILLCFYLIITTINPKLSVFNFNNLPEAPSYPDDFDSLPGAYFNRSEDCQDSNVRIENSSVPDFGADYNNRINSVQIMHDYKNQSVYFSILYSNPGYSGKCQFVDWNSPCDKIDTAKINVYSASVHRLDENSGGDGVYFYRKPLFDPSGGYLKIPGGKIAEEGWYENYLYKMEYINEYLEKDDKCTVPIGQRDCEKFEEDGRTCLKDGRVCPKLSGTNIGSIKINGNYIVVLIYFDERNGDEKYLKFGPWESCQAFPSKDNFDKLGPRNLSLEPILNNRGIIPNYVLIIPVGG